jgi:hypothetical protein
MQPASSKAKQPGMPTTEQKAMSADVLETPNKAGTENLSGNSDVSDMCVRCMQHTEELDKVQAGEICECQANLELYWKQDCINCLQLDDSGNNYRSGLREKQQWRAFTLASELLRLHDMPLDTWAEFDEARLPPSPDPHTIGSACYSCMVNWVVNSSVDAVNNRETMAHCQTCMRLEMVTSPQQTDMFVMAEYALASRLLGEFITSPVARNYHAQLGSCYECQCGSKQASSAQAPATQPPTKSAVKSGNSNAAAAAATPAPTKSAAKDRSTKRAPAPAPPAAAGSVSADDAACIRCARHMSSVFNTEIQGSQQRSESWRRDCVACLEADMEQYYSVRNFIGDDDADGDITGADLQALVAKTLSYALLVDLGVPFPERVTVDVSKLPPAPSSGNSKACNSCILQWVLTSSMAVAHDHDLVVHCHMCLHELDVQLEATDPAHARQAWHNARQQKLIIWFALASRYVGKIVASPLVRIIAKEGLADMKDAEFAAHLKVLSGVDHDKTRRAADSVLASSRTSSNSKADKRSVLETVQYGFDDSATGLFSWVASAWFQSWGPV